MIKNEFGVRIDLNDKQAIDRFVSYANQSASDALKTCSNELVEQLVPNEADTEHEESAEKTAAGVRYYRGQPVTETASAARPVVQDHEIEEEIKKTKTVIYRGRKIAC